MPPFLFSCNRCPQTFISSKILRSHGCDDISNIRSSATEEKKGKDSVRVFPSPGTIEGVRCLTKESESNQLKETEKGADLAEAAVAVKIW